MKIIFAGTTNFSVFSLRSLMHFCQQSVEHELIGVYTQPDRPQGRGRRLQANAVKQYAEKYALPVYQPVSLRTKEARELLEDLQPDLIVVAAYGLLLPLKVLAIPRLGCINVHASLLPRWRGAAPIQRSILAGDAVTGVTIMQMDVGLDTGDMLYQVEEPILPGDTSATLETKLAALGADALITTIQQISERQAARQPQPEQGVCYASKLTKEEGMVHWSLQASVIERQIRAFNPWPISFSWLENEKIRIWQARTQRAEGLQEVAPGMIVGIDSAGIQVATGQDIIQLTHIQREGGRCMAVTDLLNGALSHLKVGMSFKGAK